MTTSSNADSFTFRPIARFPMLEQFDSIEAFERHYRDYEQRCLDASHGGSDALRCLVGAALWEREVFYYYRRLHARLEGEDRRLLETSQHAWETEKAASLKLARRLLHPAPEAGTAALLMESDALTRLAEQLNRARALVLRQWWEQLTHATD